MFPTLLESSSYRPKALALGYMLGLVGICLLVPVLGHVASVVQLGDGRDWSTTPAVSGSCDPFFGAHYEIVVDGRTVTCSGGRSKCPSSRDASLVGYDPDNPSRCRLASSLGKLGEYEVAALLGALSFLLVGSATAAGHTSGAGNWNDSAAAAHTVAHNAWLRRGSWTLFVFAVLCAWSGLIFLALSLARTGL